MIYKQKKGFIELSAAFANVLSSKSQVNVEQVNVEQKQRQDLKTEPFEHRPRDL